MLQRITNFIKIPSFFTGNEDKKTAKKEDKVSKGENEFKKIFETLGKDSSKVNRFFRDSNLTTSLRLFSKQVSKLTSNILTSNLPPQDKKATLKTAIEQLKSAVSGRQYLLSHLDTLQKAKIFVLHGKTVESLQRNLVQVEAQIKYLEGQLTQLEKESAAKRESGKALPKVPQQKIDENTRLNVEDAVNRVVDSRFKDELQPIVPLLASIYGVAQSSTALEGVLSQKINRSSNKDVEVQRAQEFIGNYLKTIHPDEFKNKDKMIAFTKLVVSVYKHSEALKDDQLAIACNNYFGKERFQEILNSGKQIPSIDQNALSALQNHAHEVVGIEGTPPVSERPPTDFNHKLEALGKEKNLSKYQKILKEVSLALHEDSLDAFGAVQDHDIFDPGKSSSGGGTKALEDKARLFIMDPTITPRERTRRIEVILDISKQLYDQKNYLAATNFFNTVYAFPTLNDIPVSSKHLKIKEELGKLLEQSSNYKNYREFIQKEKGFYMPMLTVHLKDLTLARDTAKDQKPDLFSLKKLGQLRTEYFNHRDQARAVSRKSPYSFMQPDAANSVYNETKLANEKAGLTLKPGQEASIEKYQDLLRRKIKDEMGALKAKP